MCSVGASPAAKCSSAATPGRWPEEPGLAAPSEGTGAPACEAPAGGGAAEADAVGSATGRAGDATSNVRPQEGQTAFPSRMASTPTTPPQEGQDFCTFGAQTSRAEPPAATGSAAVGPRISRRPPGFPSYSKANVLAAFSSAARDESVGGSALRTYSVPCLSAATPSRVSPPRLV